MKILSLSFYLPVTNSPFLVQKLVVKKLVNFTKTKPYAIFVREVDKSR